ncbi:hypothetical protein QTA58_05235 [Neorhizobium sp. CSC1952]|uniref:Uncharacterized protein n=1 Tax=Xaviernesmea oryzae TaxID=464029 RepID=A0A1X7EZC3_9HYPH|nr:MULTISPECIES: hypothetical protein [Rhizobium/Agrobacterium group]WJR68163.1 hypothetical protein QTA58_05235 [Rhizobium sp. CSC1952]SMF42952.1 hypothetical protein SAMN02982989_2063 [Xaviernesmea oryzae]
MSDREPTVIDTGGSGGWAVAAILLIVIIAGGLILFEGGYLGTRNVDIDVSLPKVEAPQPITR